MNRRQACIRLVGAAGSVGMAACVPGSTSTRRARQTLLIGGASAMLPMTRALAAQFMRSHADLAVVVERGGSLPAYIAASRGAIDVAAMTRGLSDGEDSAGAHQYLIARGHIDVVVNRALPVTGLTQSRLHALLSGEIVNWRAVGGPDLEVTVCVQARSATGRLAAEQVVLGGGDFTVDAREFASDAALLAAVAANPGAIACIDGSMRAGAGRPASIAIDGVAPSHGTVLTGRYPYTYSFHLLLHGATDGASGEFVRFARSAAGQAIVAGFGLVSVC